MSGNITGGRKARDTILKTRPDHYKVIGKVGGQAKVKKGFAISGKASASGKIGGSRSSRRGIPNKNKESVANDTGGAV